MIAEAIDKIIHLSHADVVKIDDKTFTTKPVHPVKEAEPDTLTVHTLTGIADYIVKSPDGVAPETMTIHIVSPSKINLYSPLFGDFEQRSTYVRAELLMDKFPYGQFMDLEMFNIRLQSMFKMDPTVANILSIIGNLVDETVQTIGDDGVSQMVTKRHGIQRRENVLVPNPVELTPYRTFIEADQPTSKFIFRMKSRDGELPVAALFEADGGMWKVQAIQNLMKWFEERNLGTKIIA